MEKVIKGGNTNNLTKVIIEALENHANFSNVDVVTKLCHLKLMALMFSKGCATMGLPNKSKTNLLLIWKAFTLAHCMNLIMQAWS